MNNPLQLSCQVFKAKHFTVPKSLFRMIEQGESLYLLNNVGAVREIKCHQLHPSFFTQYLIVNVFFFICSCTKYCTKRNTTRIMYGPSFQQNLQFHRTFNSVQPVWPCLLRCSSRQRLLLRKIPVHIFKVQDGLNGSYVSISNLQRATRNEHRATNCGEYHTSKDHLTFFHIGTVLLSSSMAKCTASRESFRCSEDITTAMLTSEIGHGPNLCWIRMWMSDHWSLACVILTLV
jgi:hypothetical protein